MDEQTRKALELAREALTRSSYYDPEPAIYAIRAALSAPAAPVAQPLTDEQIDQVLDAWFDTEPTDDHRGRMRSALACAHGIGQGDA